VTVCCWTDVKVHDLIRIEARDYVLSITGRVVELYGTEGKDDTVLTTVALFGLPVSREDFGGRGPRFDSENWKLVEIITREIL